MFLEKRGNENCPLVLYLLFSFTLYIMHGRGRISWMLLKKKRRFFFPWRLFSLEGMLEMVQPSSYQPEREANTEKSKEEESKETKPDIEISQLGPALPLHLLFK